MFTRNDLTDTRMSMNGVDIGNVISTIDTLDISHGMSGMNCLIFDIWQFDNEKNRLVAAVLWLWSKTTNLWSSIGGMKSLLFWKIFIARVFTFSARRGFLKEIRIEQWNCKSTFKRGPKIQLSKFAWDFEIFLMLKRSSKNVEKCLWYANFLFCFIRIALKKSMRIQY